MEILRDLRKLLQFPVVYTHTTAKGSERAPSPSSTAKILSKRDGHLGSGPRGLWVFCALWRKRGQPRQLTFGERGPTHIAARSSSHSLRYVALRSD